MYCRDVLRLSQLSPAGVQQAPVVGAAAQHWQVSEQGQPSESPSGRQKSSACSCACRHRSARRACPVPVAPAEPNLSIFTACHQELLAQVCGRHYSLGVSCGTASRTAAKRSDCAFFAGHQRDHKPAHRGRPRTGRLPATSRAVLRRRGRLPPRRLCPRPRRRRCLNSLRILVAAVIVAVVIFVLRPLALAPAGHKLLQLPPLLLPPPGDPPLPAVCLQGAQYAKRKIPHCAAARCLTAAQHAFSVPTASVQSAVAWVP